MKFKCQKSIALKIILLFLPVNFVSILRSSIFMALKRIMKKLLIAGIIILCHLSTNAQNSYKHGMFATRIIFNDHLSKKLRYELFLQRRTQNDGDGSLNFFDERQFSSVWLWFNYQYNPHLKLSASPFGYFESSPLITKEGDENLPPVKEFRFSLRAEYENKGKVVNFINRYSLEYRRRDLLQNNVYQPNWRIRYMARFEKPVKKILSPNKPLTFMLYDEVFVQFGKAVANKPNVFDQNRLFVGAGYEVFKNVRLQLGYMYLYQERASGKDFDNTNALWTVVHFDNIISQFKHK